MSDTSSRRRRKSRGQALVEFCLLAPPLLIFVLLTVDVGRAFWESIDAAGASRAGVRMGMISDTSDIGSAIRDEPNTGIPNTVAAWGAVGPGQAEGTCTVANQTCGDPGGCQASYFSGGSYACFAVRTCSASSGSDLGSISGCDVGWGHRPINTGHIIQVKIVIKFPAVTPALNTIVAGGNLYLTQTAYGNELYF